MEIITGVERRCHWHDDQKLQVLAELEQPGTTFVEVARRRQISRGPRWPWQDARRRGQRVRGDAGLSAGARRPETANARRARAAAGDIRAATPDIDDAPDHRIAIVPRDGAAVRVTQDIRLRAKVATLPEAPPRLPPSLAAINSDRLSNRVARLQEALEGPKTGARLGDSPPR